MRTKHGRHNHPAKVKRELERLHRTRRVQEPVSNETGIEKLFNDLNDKYKRLLEEYHREKPKYVFRQGPVPRSQRLSLPAPPPPLQIGGRERRIITQRLVETVALPPTHPYLGGYYKPKQRFKVICNRRPFDSLFERFQLWGIAPNVKTLYHGTTLESVFGITIEGWFRPGRLSCMFGPGCYFGPLDKALVYGPCVIQADVILGNSKLMESAQYVDGEILWSEGYQSVYGRRGLTKGWNGALVHDEYVVYFWDQILPRFVTIYERKEAK